MEMQQTVPNEMAGLTKVQSEKESAILDLPNVVGVALGNKFTKEEDTGKPCITAFVSAKLDRSMLSDNELVPKKINQTPTDVVEIGDIFAGDIEPPPVGTNLHVSEVMDVQTQEAQPAESRVQMPTEGIYAGPFSNALIRRIRPVMGGFSVGHYKITAGTIGTCCYDLTPFPGVPSKYYILSNNHVLANSNNANIGDWILQPGPYDGGSLYKDAIARLSRYVPIKFHTATSKPLNYVDAAIAEGSLEMLSREIYWQGVVKDLYVAPKVGDIVQKSGRTTGFTTGRVTNINATVDVNYGSGRVARFRNQIVTERMGSPGDSGSLVCDRDENAVGLLFAGSSTRTIINNILLVQLLLKVRIHEK
ncbi:MAG: hypothetical protein PVI92_04470 [Chromatiales bacterium]|jgi:hypothetical protein